MCEDADGRGRTRADAMWRCVAFERREGTRTGSARDASGRKLDAEGRDRGREGDAIGRALGREGTHTQTHRWYEEAHTGPCPCISTMFNIG